MHNDLSRFGLMQNSFINPVIAGKVSIGQGINFPLQDKSYICFRPTNVLRYHAICDDFGPMNLSSITRFVEMLEFEMETHPSKIILYFVEHGRRALSNALFLMGAFLILKNDMTAQDVSKIFDWVAPSMIEPFRDATFSNIDFGLSLTDCWEGLERGKTSGWIKPPTTFPEMWGSINVHEYQHYDDPNNADLHEVIPGKLIAFKGPKDLGQSSYFDDDKGFRHFSPQHFVDIFQSKGVTSIVRLNSPEYDKDAFTSHGFDHHDLSFEDCTCPPARTIEAFFQVLSRHSHGAVAVHCKAGLGRTGTLIALALMRCHGFTARQAMGWLRIIRPGSVIGPQQHFLCEVERGVRAIADRHQPVTRRAQLRRPAAAAPRAHSLSGCGGGDAADAAAGDVTAVQPRPPSCSRSPESADGSTCGLTRSGGAAAGKVACASSPKGAAGGGASAGASAGGVDVCGGGFGVQPPAGTLGEHAQALQLPPAVHSPGGGVCACGGGAAAGRAVRHQQALVKHRPSLSLPDASANLKGGGGACASSHGHPPGGAADPSRVAPSVLAEQVAAGVSRRGSMRALEGQFQVAPASLPVSPGSPASTLTRMPTRMSPDPRQFPVLPPIR